MVGPSLVGCGVFFAFLRVLFCTIPSCCKSCCRRKKNDPDTKSLIEVINIPLGKSLLAEIIIKCF